MTCNLQDFNMRDDDFVCPALNQKLYTFNQKLYNFNQKWAFLSGFARILGNYTSILSVNNGLWFDCHCSWPLFVTEKNWSLIWHFQMILTRIFHDEFLILLSWFTTCEFIKGALFSFRRATLFRDKINSSQTIESQHHRSFQKPYHISNSGQYKTLFI